MCLHDLGIGGVVLLGVGAPGLKGVDGKAGPAGKDGAVGKDGKDGRRHLSAATALGCWCAGSGGACCACGHSRRVWQQQPRVARRSGWAVWRGSDESGLCEGVHRGRVLCGLQHVPKQPCGTASLSRCSTASAVALHTRRVSMRRSHTGSAAAQQWGVCSSGPAVHCESQHGAVGIGLRWCFW